jgi:hypothetical protein
MTATTIETITGLVEQINSKRTGIKVSGEWLTISQYHALAQLPECGQRVDVQVARTDRGAWISSVAVLDDGQVHQLPQQPRRGGGGGRSPVEQRDIRRLSVLKAAAAFASSRPDLKSADVLAIAGRWLKWIEDKGGDQSA